jgi:hypothetical protein
MKPTAEIIEGYERCQRIPFWGKSWERGKLTPLDMLNIAAKAGLTESRQNDYGMAAGEELFSLGATRQIDSRQHDIHAEVVHLSTLIDIVISSVRKPTDAPWGIPESLERWKSSCFLSPDGSHLRKIVFVSGWSKDRHYALCRDWGALGEVAFHNIPLHIVVVVLGTHQDGRYKSFWTRALRHPVNKTLKFRKKQNIASGFKNTWDEIFREDHDEYTTTQWLEGMLKDDVLRDVLFRVDVNVQEKPVRQRIIDLANRKLDRIEKLKSLPDENLSGCSWPIKCDFIRSCHNGDEPSGRYGFVPVDSLNLR